MSVPNRYGIKEVFVTLQGEGERAGTKAVFVRFSGCNLWDGHPLHRDRGEGPCAKWCDTDFFKGTPLETEALLEQMNNEWPRSISRTRWCVLTGGEPGLQLDMALVKALHDDGWFIAIETNGTIDSDAVRECTHICLSPKRGTNWKALGRAHEVKVILPGAAPGSPGWTDDELEEMSVLMSPAMMFVQPQDPIIAPDVVEETVLRSRHASGPGKDLGKPDPLLKTILDHNVARCLEFIDKHPSWRLSLQTHKFIDLP